MSIRQNPHFHYFARDFFLRLIRYLIHKSLTFDADQRIVGSLRVIYFQGNSIVVAEIKLGQIALQVLRIAMLIDACHAALEDREHAFDGIGVHIAPSVFLTTVIDGFMARILLADLAELLMLVGHQIRAGIEVIAKRTLHASKVLAGNVGGLHFAVTLDQGENGVLFALAGIAALASGRTATDECFVGLHDPATLTKLADLNIHRKTNAMGHEPGRLVGDSKRAMNLVGTDPFLGAA